MIVRFDETVPLPPEVVYDSFRTPADWTRYFGFPGGARSLGDGWYSVPLENFPFPLVARNIEEDPPRRVRWVFRGFWKGEGEVRITSIGEGSLVEGYERVSVRPLSLLSPIVEKLLLERVFKAIWAVGWHRMRKAASAAASRR